MDLPEVLRGSPPWGLFFVGVSCVELSRRRVLWRKWHTGGQALASMDIQVHQVPLCTRVTSDMILHWIRVYICIFFAKSVKLNPQAVFKLNISGLPTFRLWFPLPSHTLMLTLSFPTWKFSRGGRRWKKTAEGIRVKRKIAITLPPWSWYLAWGRHSSLTRAGWEFWAAVHSEICWAACMEQSLHPGLCPRRCKQTVFRQAAPGPEEDRFLPG